MKQNDFVYQSRPGRVVFGAGSLQHLERELLALGATRALVLAAPDQRPTAADIASRLGERCAGIFDRVVMHVPIEVAREAQALARTLSADCVIAFGGGSSIGLGKAIALNSGLRILAIPTTYAGSEMTPIFGLTEAGVKRTGTDLKVLPRTVIYDPELTMTLPAEMSVASGMNALAHAAEGLYAQDANPITSLMSEEAIGALARGLRGVTRDANDIGARTDALYGAARGHGAGRRRHGAAPQAVPHARRQLQPAPRADARRDVAARPGLQRQSSPRRDGARRARAWCPPCGAGCL